MLSEVERNAFFERKKKETIERLLGKENRYPIPDSITVRYTSDAKAGPWYNRPRILKNMNVDQQGNEYLAWYNFQKRANNGRIVTKVDTPLEAEVGAPIK